jgi:hypothetical protein
MKTHTWSPLFTVVLAGASVLAGGVTLSLEFEIEARDQFGAGDPDAQYLAKGTLICLEEPSSRE